MTLQEKKALAMDNQRKERANAYMRNDKDSGRFGRAFELSCARALSNKKSVSKQGVTDVSVKFRTTKGFRYEPAECKINGGRVDDLLNGKNKSKYVIGRSFYSHLAFYIIITIFILIIAGWFEKNEIAMNGKQRLWVLAISFGIILLVFTAMYISWSIVGSQIISGVQGRYFIPTAILILLCLSLKNNYLKIRHIKTIFMCSMILINIIAIKSIIQFF